MPMFFIERCKIITKHGNSNSTNKELIIVVAARVLRMLAAINTIVS